MNKPTVVIGIDCAVQPQQVGLALGQWDGQRGTVAQVATAACPQTLLDTLISWIAKDVPTLLALDAPLGWPASLGPALVAHRAGNPLPHASNQLFRRKTDDVVYCQLGKRSLDVGADRIARTAIAALELLQKLRERTGRTVSLAWTPALDIGIWAIEVYPAATLAAYGITARGYKRSDGDLPREVLLDAASIQLDLPDDRNKLLQNQHLIDACLCVLAGCDFLASTAIQPDDHTIAEQEGWIWVRRRKPHS